MTALIAGQRQPAHWTRIVARGLLALLLGGLLVLLGAQSATAHSQLLSTTPEDGAALEQAPAEAVLRFNEPVQLLEGAIRLFPGDETPIILDAHVTNTDVVAPLPEGLAEGRYALSYRVVSADGHPVSGAISFTIGEATGPTPAPQIQTATPHATEFALDVLTALQYLGLLAFAGLIFFDRAVLRNRGPVSGRTRSTLRAAGIVAVVASGLLIPVSALNATGEGLGSILTPAVWWPGVLWPPLVAAGAVVVGTGVGYLTGRRARATVLPIGAALVALGSPVLVGHSMLVEPRALVIAADLGHLFAGAFWLGGVLGLLLFLAQAGPVRRASASDADPLLAARVVQRFSRYAIWSVVLLAASGTVMGVMIVGTLDALLTTGYGLTLLLKLGVVIAVIAIAAYNRHRLLPAIIARPTARMKWRLLHRTLAYEAALLATVLAITGFLGNQSPTHEHHDTATGTTAVAQTTALHASAQQLTVAATLAPALTGDNELVFTLNYQDQPVAPEAVTVRASLPAHDLGPFQIVPELDAATGHYTATLNLPVAGDWQIQILARVSTFAEPIVTLPATIR